MPYIVLNIEELINFLKSYPGVKQIQLNRSFEVLGGQNFRYLPKELYLKNTGGAETALVISLDRQAKKQQTKIIYDDFLEGHAYLRKHRLKRYAYTATSRVIKKLKGE